MFSGDANQRLSHARIPLRTQKAQANAYALRGNSLKASSLGVGAFFFEPGRLATKLAQIVQLCAAYFGMAHHLDFVEAG